MVKNKQGLLSKEKLLVGNKEKNTELVKKYLAQWEEFRNGKMKELEQCLSVVFKSHPANTNLNEVLIKVSLLNDFYSTHILDTYSVAKVIHSMNIDAKLKAGDLNLVNEIVDTIDEKTKCNKQYSFITKYCSFHQPNLFPIYDGDNQEILHAYKTEYNLSEFDFTKKSLKEDFKNYLKEDYKNYVKAIEDYKKVFCLEEFSYKEIDRFNWTFCEINK